MKVNFLLVSPRNVKFDPEKILYWPIFGLWTMEGIYFQFLKSPHSSPLGKIFCSNFCWRQQKIEIHLSQQQKIILTRLTPVESPDKVK